MHIHDDPLATGVANILPSRETLVERLSSKEPLRVYLGIDPTATQIHIGHAVPLRLLQSFATKGHEAFLLIGDFTALIGDTSDKDSERPVLSGEEIEANFKTYKKQAEKIVDFSRVRVVYNSAWLSSLTFTDIVKLCQHFSFGDFASRELIAKRLKNKQHVGLHEALYPVMQGYDMYHLDADIQIGGTDQTFNMQAGRHLQRKLHNKETFVIATEFLPGTDGKKMSKTGGNAIWLSDPARDMYRKIMAIDDSQIPAYASLGTNMSSEETRSLLSAYQANTLHPMDAKKMLAHRLVSELHDSTQADDAADFFQASVQQKTVSIGEIREVTIDSDEASIPLAQFLTQTGAVHTISQAKDLIKQGSVQINGTALRYPNMHMSEIINDLPSVLLRVNRTLSLRIVIK